MARPETMIRAGMILLLLTGLTTGRGIAQGLYGTDFILLESGERLEGTVEVKKEFLRREHLMLNDSVKVALDSVQTYKTAEGYYSRIPDNSGLNRIRFAERVEEGNIDLFVRKTRHKTPPHYATGGYGGSAGFGGAGYVGGSISVSTKYEYFSIDGSELSKANYSNLKNVLNDNEKSMRYLKQHRDQKTAAIAMIIGGLAIVGGSLTTIGDDGGLPAGVFIGLGIATSSWLVYPQNKVQKAIDAYNREALITDF